MVEGERRYLLTEDRQLLLILDPAGNVKLFRCSEQTGLYEREELHEKNGLLIQVKTPRCIKVCFMNDT